jgi:putative ABC transport system permease protein
MKLIKIFKHALGMVLHSKIRSWLTILGIVIGVAAVTAITSLGSGLQQEINSQLGALGGDLLTLRAGASRASGFGGGRGPEDFGGGSSSGATIKAIVIEKRDVQVLKGISDIKVMDTEISGRVDVYYVAEKGSTSVTGVDPAAWYLITTSKLADGRMLGPADSNVVVVGGRIASGFFTKKLGVNQVITIKDRLFRIVGILDDQSSSIYMPIDEAYTIVDDKEKGIYDTVIIKVKDESQLDATMATITQKLSNSRHAQKGKLDFTLTSNKERQAQREAMMASMTTFLTAIAAVALLVGAVGIANTMFTSVLEKTKEIGIMKAIGARNNAILGIFLLNAGLIGLIGGVIGIIFGILLSGFLPSLMGSAAGPMSRFGAGIISTRTILIAIGMSVLIGMLAGAVPAYQGSRLRPVDALRYE